MRYVCGLCPYSFHHDDNVYAEHQFAVHVAAGHPLDYEIVSPTPASVAVALNARILGKYYRGEDD